MVKAPELVEGPDKKIEQTETALRQAQGPCWKTIVDDNNDRTNAANQQNDDLP